MTQSVIIVNASGVVSDAEVRAKVAPLQKQVDRDFLPAWSARAAAVQLGFATALDIPRLPADSWPIFLNRHSNDPGALGWHDDQTGRIFSRVFVGDALRFGLDWGVTLSHELLELILDPDVKRAWRMPSGRLAALEACDAVEDDKYGYDVDGMRVSNFVLPAYFSTGPGPYDHGGILKAACPALSDGGYMSVTDAAGEWTQLSADLADGLSSARALTRGHRRQRRSQRTLAELEEVSFP